MHYSELMKLIKVEGIARLEDRIILQKKIYFLRIFEVLKKPMYKFSWYHYGPYSSELADDAFPFFEKQIDKEIEIDESRMKVFCEVSQKLGEDSIKWEMAASIHFLKTTESTLTKDKIFQRVSQKRSYLDDKEKFEETWNLLRL